MKEYILDEHTIEESIRRIIQDKTHHFSMEFMLAHFSEANREAAKRVLTRLAQQGYITKSPEPPHEGRILYRLNRDGERVSDPFKVGYCQRVKNLLLDANPQYKTWDECPYIILDYPLKETVAILVPTKTIGVSPTRLEEYNAEIRLIKPVKNGTIIAYHFND